MAKIPMKKPSMRRLEANMATSRRMKARSVTSKFNSESMDRIRSSGSVRGSDVFQPDAGIDKKTGKGTMYSQGQYNKVKDFDARVQRASNATFAKGAAVGGVAGGAAVGAGMALKSYWSNKKQSDAKPYSPID